ncbi:hypothetical protein M5689_024651 [Euphorbia peplus]|nr:hypothetical protein M5689_024651 [Euphorbia peplus]
MAQEQVVAPITVTYLFSSKEEDVLSESRVFTSRFLENDVKLIDPISKWLSAQNRNSFVSLNEFIYLALVNEFYQNLRYQLDEKDIVRSSIAGMDFEVSRTSISQVIGI